MYAKKKIAAVRRWWKAGRNAWEIEQLTGFDRETVRGILEIL